MRLVFFDLESTGTDPYNDRIVEVAMHEALREGRRVEYLDPFHALVNPGMPIPAEATEVHGITDEDVADAPPFISIAPAVQNIAWDAVLVGYNSRTFDVILLDAELRRSGQPGLPRDTAHRIVVPEIDLLRIWIESERRTLDNAVARFAPEFEPDHDAHRAGSDTSILPFVLAGMCEAFGLDPEDLEALQKISVPEGTVDRDGKFRREGEHIVFAFGPHQGDPVRYYPDFLEWMLKKDFSPETKGIARLLLSRIRRAAPVASGQQQGLGL